MAEAAVKQGSDFVAKLEAANLHPLWDRFRTLTPVKPQAKDPPLIWRWRDIEPFTARAVSEVRRVLRGGGEARVMLYSRHSWLALGAWLRWSLARGRPWRSISVPSMAASPPMASTER